MSSDDKISFTSHSPMPKSNIFQAFSEFDSTPVTNKHRRQLTTDL